MSKKIKSKVITCCLFLCMLSPLAVISQGGFNPPTPGEGDDAGFGDDVEDEIVPINSLILLSLVAGGIFGIRKIRKNSA